MQQIHWTTSRCNRTVRNGKDITLRRKLSHVLALKWIPVVTVLTFGLYGCSGSSKFEGFEDASSVNACSSFLPSSGSIRGVALETELNSDGSCVITRYSEDVRYRLNIVLMKPSGGVTKKKLQSMVGKDGSFVQSPCNGYETSTELHVFNNSHFVSMAYGFPSPVNAAEKSLLRDLMPSVCEGLAGLASGSKPNDQKLSPESAPSTFASEAVTAPVSESAASPNSSTALPESGSSTNPVYAFMEHLSFPKEFQQEPDSQRSIPNNEIVYDTATRSIRWEEEIGLSGQTRNGYSATGVIYSSAGFRAPNEFMGDANGCSILPNDGIIFLDMSLRDTSKNGFDANFGPNIDQGGNGYTMKLLTGNRCGELNADSFSNTFGARAGKCGFTWRAALLVRNLCQGSATATPDNPFGRVWNNVRLDVGVGSRIDDSYGGWTWKALDNKSVYDTNGIRIASPYSLWSESETKYFEYPGDSCSNALSSKVATPKMSESVLDSATDEARLFKANTTQYEQFIKNLIGARKVVDGQELPSSWDLNESPQTQCMNGYLMVVGVSGKKYKISYPLFSFRKRDGKPVLHGLLYGFHNEKSKAYAKKNNLFVRVGQDVGFEVIKSEDYKVFDSAKLFSFEGVEITPSSEREFVMDCKAILKYQNGAFLFSGSFADLTAGVTSRPEGREPEFVGPLPDTVLASQIEEVS
jgi:hypothetical protein